MSAYPQQFIDFSAIRNSTESQARAIQALLSRRLPQSLRQIQRYFRATPIAATNTAVDYAVERGWIEMRRNGLSRRAGYVYEYDRRDA